MYKALTSFSGVTSMTKGQVAEIKDAEIVKDLLNAGYIEEIKDNKEDIEVNKEVKKESTKKKKK